MGSSASPWSTPQPALVIPQSAVLLDQAGHYASVVDAANKVELRRVTTGIEQGRNVVVTDGLKAGEPVIVEDGRRDTEGASRSSRGGERRVGTLRRMFSSLLIDRPRLAFVIPIVITLAATRHAVGTPVFSRMIAASLSGVFISLLYITAESLRKEPAKSVIAAPHAQVAWIADAISFRVASPAAGARSGQPCWPRNAANLLVAPHAINVLGRLPTTAPLIR